MNTLPIYERFLSFQGEGIHAGRKAFIIRTLGCPICCQWCDAAATWHCDYVPKGDALLDIDSLAAEAAKSRPEFVVVTGGEPAIHGDITALALSLRSAGLCVHLETSGAFWHDCWGGVGPPFHWIAVSPKATAYPVKQMLEHADEVKLVVDNLSVIDNWLETLEAILGYRPTTLHRCKAIWLYPEWSQRDDPELLAYITAEIKHRGGKFRAGWQTNKLYSADLYDKRTRPGVPLGGNPRLGY